MATAKYTAPPNEAAHRIPEAFFTFIWKLIRPHSLCSRPSSAASFLPSHLLCHSSSPPSPFRLPLEWALVERHNADAGGARVRRRQQSKHALVNCVGKFNCVLIWLTYSYVHNDHYRALNRNFLSGFVPSDIWENISFTSKSKLIM